MAWAKSYQLEFLYMVLDTDKLKLNIESRLGFYYSATYWEEESFLFVLNL